MYMYYRPHAPDRYSLSARHISARVNGDQSCAISSINHIYFQQQRMDMFTCHALEAACTGERHIMH